MIVSGASAAKITTSNIKDLSTALKSGKPVVAKLGADKCYYCRLMKPILSKLAVEMEGKAVFLDLDIYEHRDLARKFRISLIPTILFYDKTGKYRFQKVGFMGREELLEQVKKLK